LIDDGRGLIRFESLGEQRGVSHAFAPATALGGFDALSGNDRRRLRDVVLGTGSSLALTNQTHSRNVARAFFHEGSAGGVAFDRSRSAGIDGLITDERGLLLHAVSADCPLLFLSASPGNELGARPVVAVVHCGWRGVAGGIVQEVLARLDAEWGVAPEDLVAAVSPGVGGCCYEVGDEVLDRLSAAGVDATAYAKAGSSGRPYLDLKGVLGEIVKSSGVAADRVRVAPECTICGGDAFHSYRRSREKAGRMSGVIGLMSRS